MKQIFFEEKKKICKEKYGGRTKFWSGLVWSGLVWSGLVWSGLVWSGLVCDLERDEAVFTLLLPASQTNEQTTT